MTYGLGNFADQLSLDQVNGALGNVGSDYRVGGGIQAPAAPSPTSPPPPAWEKPEEKKGGGLGNVLGLVGSFMGGPYGAVLGTVGGMMGGKK